MKNELDEQILARQSWLDCIGQLNEINHQYYNDFIENPEPQLQHCKSHIDNKIPCFQSQFTPKLQKNLPYNIQSQKQSKRSRADIYSQEDISSERICSQQNQIKQYEEDSRQSQKTDKKQNKSVKQSVYSKSYRQRKKQQLKILQEENNFLKKKINELQFRLREKQLQINRLKFPAIEKDLTVEQLNEQFLKKTNLLLSKTATDPINYGKTVYTPSDILYMQFLKSYDEHGFGGRRKKNILNYYFNEMLQAMMRDSERYLFLMCNQSKDPNSIHGLETYEQIDSTFVEVMELNEQKIQRLNYFSKGLHPYMLELKDTCVQIYADFKKIVAVLERVHSFMKQSYLTNMDFARKRIQFENWFDSQKHSKLMRRLRSDWLQFVKNQAQNGSEQKKKNSKGSKKKKLTSKDDQSPK